MYCFNGKFEFMYIASGFGIGKNEQIAFFDKNGICMVARVCDENKIRQSYLFGAVDARGKYVVPCIYKKEEEVMAKIGRTERSFKYLNNK